MSRDGPKSAGFDDLVLSIVGDHARDSDSELEPPLSVGQGVGYYPAEISHGGRYGDDPSTR
eukprot:13460996-Heterocapsa_arctica.AAC.1